MTIIPNGARVTFTPETSTEGFNRGIVVDFLDNEDGSQAYVIAVQTDDWQPVRYVNDDRVTCIRTNREGQDDESVTLWDCATCRSNGVDPADCPDLPENHGTTGGRRHGAPGITDEVHSLFVAVALANGAGGELERVYEDGSHDPSLWRIIACDPTEDGVARMTLARFTGDDGAISLRYADTSNATGWKVAKVSETGPADDVPATPTGRVIPRNAAEAIALAQRLQDFARWLPGGELEAMAHEQAANANLCGEYEHIVCPTFGWTPRRGEESSAARWSRRFFQDLDTFEDQHANLTPLDRLSRWMDRYKAGGFANMAIVQHADDHLEQHKRESLNGLLTDTLGWEPIPTTTEYEVTVRIERTREVREHAYVTVTVTADDEDQAGDLAIDIADPDYYADWEVDDDEWDTSETDREVYEVNPA